MIKELSIDLETYSDVDISKCGAYKYAESDHFEILLFGVSVDNGPVVVYDLTAGDEIPTEILEALSDENITKWAFNASFERVCLSNWLRKHHPEYFKPYNSEDDPVHNYLNPSSWKCTMIWSAYMGLLCHRSPSTGTPCRRNLALQSICRRKRYLLCIRQSDVWSARRKAWYKLPPQAER